MRAADAHPNVVTVRDYAVQDEYLCVMMDLASGGDLFDVRDSTCFCYFPSSFVTP